MLICFLGMLVNTHSMIEKELRSLVSQVRPGSKVIGPGEVASRGYSGKLLLE
jgi:hypothetical protein